MQGTQAEGVKKPEKIKMSQEELDEVVSLHKRFMEGRMGGRRAILKKIDLSGLKLKDRDMRQADFTGCDMSGMDLSGSDFREASLYACNLSYANLNKTSFVRADLRGSVIESANLKEANLDNADLRAGGLSDEGDFMAESQMVNFRGANLSGARLVGSLASSADFSDAIMAKADLTGADLRGAHFEGADLTEADIKGAQLVGAKMEATILTGVRLDEINSSGVDVSHAITDENVGKSIDELEAPLAKLIKEHRSWVSTVGREGRQLDLTGYDMRMLLSLSGEKLTAIKAKGARWCGMDLTDIHLQSANLDESDFRSCFMRGADVRASSMVGTRFSHADLRNADFGPLYFKTPDGDQKASPSNLEKSNFRYANCAGASFKGTSFKGADLSYADFTSADMTDADFTGARMENAKFEGAKLSGAKFDEGNSPLKDIMDS